MTTPPTLRFAFEVRVQCAATVKVDGGTDQSLEVYPIIGGTVSGPDLTGSVEPIGADFARVRTDGVLRIEARYLMRAESGELIEVVNRGIYREREGQEPYFFATPELRGPAALAEITDRIYVCRAREGGDPGVIELQFFAVE